VRLLARLAVADLWAEKTLALCTLLGIAAVLAPLLVLAGLRAGVIAGLRARLLANPTAREIVSVGNREFSSDRLAILARQPDVAFLVPRVRSLAISLDAERADGAGGAVRIELVPSAPADPLLAGNGPAAPAAVVLSAAAAAQLRAAKGTALHFVLVRIAPSGVRQAVRLPVTVQGVAPDWSFARPAAFVTLALAAYAEDYQDGIAAPIANGALPRASATRSYAGFRLFARTLRDVPAVATELQRQGLDVVSHQQEVASLLGLDRDLGLLLAFVAGLGGAGYLISLGVSLWAGVERKRRSFAMLRLLGLSWRALALLPALEACLLGLVGVALALVFAEGVAFAIDRAFAAAHGDPLCQINLGIVVRALGATLTGSAVAAAAAGWRLTRIEPWEEIR